MSYYKVLIKYQKFIHWIIKHEMFGLNIQYVSGVDNVISNTPSRIPTNIKNQSDTITTSDI